MPVEATEVALSVRTASHSKGRTIQHEPLTFGVPFPRGRLTDTGNLVLYDDDAHVVPLQARAVDWWPDGSVRWVHVDFQAIGPPSAERTYRLTIERDAVADRRPRGMARVGTAVEVDTGVAAFRLAEPGGPLLKRLPTGNDAGAIGELTLTDQAGTVWPLRVKKTTVDVDGPLRTVVSVDGSAGPVRKPLINLRVRLQFFAASAAVRVAVTVHNERPAEHPGGIWEMGGRGSILLRDLSFEVRTAFSTSTVHLGVEAGDAPSEVQGGICLYQDSSGGEQWNSAVHVNRDGDVPLRFRGYAVSGAMDQRGLRATPAAVVTDGRSQVGLAMERFWQQFPKALEAEPGRVTLRLWPRQFADLHELQGGEQKTHHFVLIAAADPMAQDAVHWGRMPARVSASPEWYCASGVVPHLSPERSDCDARYRSLLAEALDGPDSFEAKRDRIDEYGWRHFGDLYADHENQFSGEPSPIVSHYNNQYDAVAGCVMQFFRTGDPRWWDLLDDLAKHVADIDIYHTDRDKPAYNHGLFWHTFHYVPAGKSTHRSYPRHSAVWGGGPGNEHNYAGGLRLHWLLTADPVSSDAATELANWVVEMDDGSKTPLRWVSDAPTGLASATQSPDFHGPGRGAAHSIQALLEGHRLTDDPRFLAKAEELIQRCIHPRDDIDAYNLLDAERRWSYIVFLQVLGRYLDYKEELGQRDDVAAYARASLLHYARWMADHERMYLDKPEILEYPTETWAAQDLRKSDIFLFACRYASDGERARFLQRADEFFDRSLTMLSASATRTMTRPIVLLLTNGCMWLGFDRATNVRWEANPEFGPKVAFVRQKTVAKKRLVAIAAAATVVVLVALARCFFLLGQ